MNAVDLMGRIVKGSYGGWSTVYELREMIEVPQVEFRTYSMRWLLPS